MTTLETARGKRNVSYQALINAKTLVFNKLREMGTKPFPAGTADIYDKELDHIREEYNKCKNEMMEFCNKTDVEKDCATFERDFQYQYLEAKEKVLEIRNNEDTRRLASTSRTPVARSISGHHNYNTFGNNNNNTYFLKCDSCFTSTHQINVSFKCEICSKNLGSLVLKSNV